MNNFDVCPTIDFQGTLVIETYATNLCINPNTFMSVCPFLLFYAKRINSLIARIPSRSVKKFTESKCLALKRIWDAYGCDCDYATAWLKKNINKTTRSYNENC